MNEYRISQSGDVKLEQEPSVGGDGLIHLTVRDLPPMVLCYEDLQNLKISLSEFIQGEPQ
jgi:hypothetical protein